MGKLIRDAKQIVPVFDGGRVVACRELEGITQSKLASLVGITPSALSQIETGRSRPTTTTLDRLAAELHVPVTTFAKPSCPIHLAHAAVPPPPADPPPREAQGHATGRSHGCRRANTVDRGRMPTPSVPARPVDPTAPIEDVADQIEAAAVATRGSLKLDHSGPLDANWVNSLERHGSWSVRDPETNRDIDAYSAVVDELPIVVLDGGSETVWDRDNFNLAHELGHLVMHRDNTERPGTVERGEPSPPVRRSVHGTRSNHRGGVPR